MGHYGLNLNGLGCYIWHSCLARIGLQLLALCGRKRVSSNGGIGQAGGSFFLKIVPCTISCFRKERITTDGDAQLHKTTLHYASLTTELQGQQDVFLKNLLLRWSHNFQVIRIVNESYVDRLGLLINFHYRSHHSVIVSVRFGAV